MSFKKSAGQPVIEPRDSIHLQALQQNLPDALGFMPDGVTPYYFVSRWNKKKGICGRWNPNTRKRCGKEPCNPDGRCNKHTSTHGRQTLPLKVGDHGGHPTKTGRKAKFLPNRLLAHYEDAMEDPDLIGLREETAIVDSLMADALASIDFHNCQAAWDNLTKIVRRYERDLAANPVIVLRAVLDEIEKGASEWDKVEKVLGLIQHKRTLVDSEVKRLEKISTSMTVKDSLVFVGLIYDLIITEFSDQPSRVARFAERLDIALGGNSLRPIAQLGAGSRRISRATQVQGSEQLVDTNLPNV